VLEEILPEHCPGRKNEQSADPEALYLITTGSSDAYASIFYNQFEQFQGLTAEQVSADLAAAITRLAKLGAKQIMVWNTVDLLPKLPLSVSAGIVDQLAQFKGQLDAKLPAQLDDLAKQLGIKISLFDYNALEAQIRSDPAKYGLKNVTDMCKTSATSPVCTSPDEYLYWDDASLSARANQIVAEAMAEQLNK
jgi:phospholipase/lecithinase/hemolysin